MTDDQKVPSGKGRYPKWMWFIGTTFGRRLSLLGLLGVLMAMVTWVVRRDGRVGDLRATVVFWLAFLLVLVLIVAVSLIDMMMIRLRFMVEHKRLVKRTFADADQDDEE